jgi:hypothetical protein
MHLQANCERKKKKFRMLGTMEPKLYIAQDWLSLNNKASIKAATTSRAQHTILNAFA